MTEWKLVFISREADCGGEKKFNGALNIPKIQGGNATNVHFSESNLYLKIKYSM